MILTAAAKLGAWGLERTAAIGVRTHPSTAYFFLADFHPHNACALAEKLRQQQIFIKPLQDPLLGPVWMRVTTALPQDNARFLAALRTLL